MTLQATTNEFHTLAHIEDLARLALVNIGDDDETWHGLAVLWSGPDPISLP